MTPPVVKMPPTQFLVLLAALQVAGVLGYLDYFQTNGYLPTPFVNDKSNTFMDFFHVMYWADHPGRYTDWRSVYPPINFLILKVIAWVTVDPSIIPADFTFNPLVDERLAATEYGAGFALRAFSPLGIAAIVLLYLGAVALTACTRLWDGISPMQRVLVGLVILPSAPVLFALDRGNIIIWSMPLLALAFTRAGWGRVLALALLINLKPYFALLLVAWLIKGRFREFAYVVLAAGTIFVVTGLLLDLNFVYFLRNLLTFASDDVFSGREVLAFPSTITAFAYTLRLTYVETRRILGFDGLLLSQMLMGINWLALAGSLSAILLSWKKVPLEIVLAVLVIAITNAGVWVGGYSVLAYPALIPVLYAMRGRWLYLGILLLIFLPLDMWTVYSEDVGQQNVFLSGQPHFITWQLSVGTLLRPSLNFVLMIAVSLEVFLIYGVQLFQQRAVERAG